MVGGRTASLEESKMCLPCITGLKPEAAQILDIIRSRCASSRPCQPWLLMQVLLSWEARHAQARADLASHFGGPLEESRLEADRFQRRGSSQSLNLLPIVCATDCLQV
eukprot:363552-Chlamydomonas_euryale.AAC.9